MSLLKNENISRYKDIGRLLFKYGGRELAHKAGLTNGFEAWDGVEQRADAEQLADDLESMGPTFVKLGQVLASRADLLPPPYLKALSRLQDDVEPFPWVQARQIFRDEFGVDPTNVFASIDPVPLAAASLGQVHRATLANGQTVVVKIQRPNIDHVVQEDLKALGRIARMLDEHTELSQRYRFLDTLRQFRRSITHELDYTREADNLRALGRNLESFERIIVPRPLDKLVSRRVLTMEHIQGVKVTELPEAMRCQLDGMNLTDTLFHAYLKQILQDGFFHADPHPGNVLITLDGRLGLIDLGMTGWIDENIQGHLLNLLLAVAEDRAEDATDLAVTLGDRTEAFDLSGFRRGIREALTTHREASLERINTGRLMMDVCRVAGDSGLLIPQELMLLGKALMSLDHIARTLAPEFDPNRAIRERTSEMVRSRTLSSFSPGQLFTNMMETRQFLGSLPRRIDRVLENLADNDVRLKIDAIDEDRLVDGVEKIANRVTVGLVLAAMIVGSAMLMRVDTDFTIMGYPGLAMILLFTALGMGLFFICETYWVDHRKRKPRR